MAEIRHIDVYAFWKKNMRYPDDYDYISLVCGLALKDLAPPRGDLYLVCDVQVPGTETIVRGISSRAYHPNVVYTKFGMAGRGCVIPEGAFQGYERNRVIKELLAQGRVRKAGTYSAPGWKLSGPVLDEIHAQMKKDFAEFNAKNRRYSENPDERLPRKNSTSLETVQRYSPITPGLEVFRVMPGQMLTSRSYVLRENDLFTGLMISQANADEMLSSVLKQGIAERVGSFQRSENEWDNGKLKLVYDRGKKPEISEGWED